MMEIDQGPARVTEFRQLGTSIDAELRRRYGNMRGFGPWRKFQYPQIETPNLMFSEIDVLMLDISKDHVVAIGRDENRQTLIWDNRVLLNGQFEILLNRDDYNIYGNQYLLARTRSNYSQNNQLYHFNSEGKQTVIIENATGIVKLLEHYNNGELYFVFASYQNDSSVPILAVNVKNGQVFRSFDLEKSVGPERIVGVNPDLSKIAIVSYSNDKKRSLFINEKLIADDTVGWRFGEDLEDYIVAAKNQEGDVVVRTNNSRMVLIDHEPSEFNSAACVAASKNLKFAAVALERIIDEADGKKGYFVYYQTPIGGGVLGPYDKPIDIEFPENKSIRGTSIRSGVARSFLVELPIEDSGNSPQVSEQAA